MRKLNGDEKSTVVDIVIDVESALVISIPDEDCDFDSVEQLF